MAWFVGYIALSALRNMFKKHISASLMNSFSVSSFKTFVNYLEVMINKLDHYISNIFPNLFIMIVRKFRDVLKTLSLNLTMGKTEMYFLQIFIHAHRDT